MVRVPVLPLLALSAVCALALSALLLAAGYRPPQLSAHLAFAFGVMPLILGAMGYFVPVLTRSSAPPPVASLPALAATGGGALTVWAFGHAFDAVLLSAAAMLGIAAGVGLFGWATARARSMVGRRHPGLDWYIAALAHLILALLAILLMDVFPERREPLRQFHLHANLLGFVGLTALGTLQVLLPTTMGRSDAGAMHRLRRDLKWALAGTLLVAVGSAMHVAGASWGRSAAVSGALLWLLVLMRMLLGWWQSYGSALLAAHGAAASLTCACAGYCGMVCAGILHGHEILAGRDAIAAYVVGFLLPLVSGAAAYLMPVWIRPGAQGPWHQALRARLCRWSALRGLVFLGAGALLALV